MKAFSQNGVRRPTILNDDLKEPDDEREFFLDHSQKQPLPGANRSIYKTLLILKDVMLLLLSILTLVALLKNVHLNRDLRTTSKVQTWDSLPGCNCGTSVAQALRLNCKYDTLSLAWLPDHCRDTELTQIFDNSGDNPDGSWTYWADLNHTQEMSVEEVGALADLPGGGLFYMTHRWHLSHCFFSWRKAVRSKTLGIMLEMRYDTEGHVEHCFSLLDDDGSRGALATVALNSNILE